MDTAVHFSSASVEWSTPQDLFDELNAEFGFTLDVCATPENAKCARYFTQEQDGLAQSWAGEVCWGNFPYGRGLINWVRKAYDESRAPGTRVVCLIPSRTDTRWFHQYVLPFAEVRFVPGRLKFNGHKNAAPFPSLIAVFG